MKRNSSQFAVILAGVLVVHLVLATALMNSARTGIAPRAVPEPYVRRAPEPNPGQVEPRPAMSPAAQPAPTIAPIETALAAAERSDPEPELSGWENPAPEVADPPRPRLKSLLQVPPANDSQSASAAVPAQSASDIEAPSAAASGGSDPLPRIVPVENPKSKGRLRKIRALPSR